MRVLMSFGVDALEANGNPFVPRLVGALEPDIDTVPFSWATALAGRYDLFHLHWPEHLVTGRPARPTRNSLLTLALVGRLALTRTPVVWTVHNEVPHMSLNRLQLLASRTLASRASHTVVMTPPADGRGRTLIRHGHYRDAHWSAYDTRAEPNRLLYFGPISSYKGVSALLRAWSGSSLAGALVIAGRNDANEGGLQEHEIEAARAMDGVELVLERLPEDALHQQILRSEAVILPYEKFHNSGAALLALSLNRPVVVPKSPATISLSEEFGSNWVICYDPPMTKESLEQALGALRRKPRVGEVDMSLREWSGVAKATRLVYDRAVKGE